MGREGLGKLCSSFQQRLPSDVVKETPLCTCRDMGTQRYSNFPSVISLVNIKLNVQGVSQVPYPCFAGSISWGKSFKQA